MVLLRRAWIIFLDNESLRQCNQGSVYGTTFECNKTVFLRVSLDFVPLCGLMVMCCYCNRLVTIRGMGFEGEKHNMLLLVYIISKSRTSLFKNILIYYLSKFPPFNHLYACDNLRICDILSIHHQKI